MSDQTPKKQMVSPQQAAEMWGVHRETILRWIRTGKLPALRLSRRIVRIRVADLEALEHQHAA